MACEVGRPDETTTLVAGRWRTWWSELGRTTLQVLTESGLARLPQIPILSDVMGIGVTVARLTLDQLV